MGTRWRGMLAPINTPTGDGRRIASGGFTHRPLPLPLKWQRSDTEGHNDSVVIGSMDRIDIDEENNAVWGYGELFDDVSPATNPRLAEDVAEAKLLLDRKVIGPSVDPGSAHGMTVIQGRDDAATDAQFEREWRATGEAPATEVLFTDYEIAAATLVPIPAFAQCRPFELLGPAAAPLTAAARDALLARPTALPPLTVDDFADPGLDRITPLTREPMANGWTRVYGHIATHDVCHVGIPGTCTTAPFSDYDYQEFHRYDSTLDDEIEFPLSVGRLTAAYGALSEACMCCKGNDDHACDRLSLGAAIAHHDRMQVLAYGRVGEDEANNAIWFNGVQAPDLGAEGVALLSRQKVSGDWRPYGGSLELTEVLVLSHRNPGFPLPRVAMQRRRQTALVAAGTVRPVADLGLEWDELGEDLPPALARMQEAFDVFGRRLAEAFEGFAFNEHQRRGPDGKWIKMGIPGLHAGAPNKRGAHNGTTGGLHTNSPEVRRARELLHNAETMHGPDRTKWTKKDQRAARKLDELIQSATYPTTTNAKPKVAQTDDRDAFNQSYLGAATQMFDQFVDNEGGWDTAYEDGPLGDVRDALDAARDLMLSADPAQRDQAIADLRETVETYYPNEIELPGGIPAPRADDNGPVVNPSGMPGSPAAEHAAARAAGVTPADRARYNRDVTAAANRVSDAQARKGSPDAALLELLTAPDGASRAADGAERDAAVDRLRQYLEANHGRLGLVKKLPTRVPSPGDATPDELTDIARRVRQASTEDTPLGRHDRDVAERVEAAVAAGDLRQARKLATPLMLLHGMTAAARTGGWDDLPMGSAGRSWDAGAARARLAEWAGDDMDRYGRAFLWHDGDPKLRGSYKLPIADVVDGTLTIIPAGVRAAASALSKTDGIGAAEQARLREVLDGLLDRVHEDDGEGMTAAAPEGGHTGAMLALRMTEQDAARLCATGGLPMDELHLTFCYLGESDQISPEQRQRIIDDMTEFAASQPGPIPGDGFALNAFNPGTANNRDTAIVMGVGGQELADAHAMASEVWGGWDGEDGTWTVPEQHSPWVPHVTLQYTDDLNAVKKLADRVGPLSFDRMRIAFGDEVTDIPFGPGVADVIEDSPDAVEAVVKPTMSAEMCDNCDKMATACADCAECAAGLAARADAGVTALRASLAHTELAAALATMPTCCG